MFYYKPYFYLLTLLGKIINQIKTKNFSVNVIYMVQLKVFQAYITFLIIESVFYNSRDIHNTLYFVISFTLSEHNLSPSEFTKKRV